MMPGVPFLSNVQLYPHRRLDQSQRCVCIGIDKFRHCHRSSINSTAHVMIQLRSQSCVPIRNNRVLVSGMKTHNVAIMNDFKADPFFKLFPEAAIITPDRIFSNYPSSSTSSTHSNQNVFYQASYFARPPHWPQPFQGRHPP